MNSTITIPAFDLTMELNRVAFSIAGRPFYWYGIIIGIGYLLAILYCHRKAPQYGIKSDDFSDLLFLMIPAALVGARLYYVLFNLESFRTTDGELDFVQMLRLWDGGAAIFGGVIAGVIVALIFCKVRKLKFFAMADLSVCGLLIGQIIGRWGNFVNVEVYGRNTTLPWRMGIFEWMGGGWMYREVHPTFLYESLWNLMGLILIVLIARRFRKFDGQNFYSYLLWYGIGRAVIEGIRDPAQNLYLFNTSLYVSQVVAILFALFGAVMLLYHFKLRPHSTEELYVSRKEAIPYDSDGREATGEQEEVGDCE